MAFYDMFFSGLEKPKYPFYPQEQLSANAKKLTDMLEQGIKFSNDPLNTEFIQQNTKLFTVSKVDNSILHENS